VPPLALGRAQLLQQGVQVQVVCTSSRTADSSGAACQVMQDQKRVQALLLASTGPAQATGSVRQQQKLQDCAEARCARWAQPRVQLMMT
jgi:hypothetical protein